MPTILAEVRPAWATARAVADPTRPARERSSEARRRRRAPELAARGDASGSVILVRIRTRLRLNAAIAVASTCRRWHAARATCRPNSVPVQMTSRKRSTPTACLWSEICRKCNACSSVEGPGNAGPYAAFTISCRHPSRTVLGCLHDLNTPLAVGALIVPFATHCDGFGVGGLIRPLPLIAVVLVNPIRRIRSVCHVWFPCKEAGLDLSGRSDSRSNCNCSFPRPARVLRDG